MIDNVKKVLVSLAALGALALGGSAIAGATSGDPSSGAGAASEEASELKVEGRESEDDDAAQAAACIAVGVNPMAEDIQYDDESGICKRGSDENEESEDEESGEETEADEGKG